MFQVTIFTSHRFTLDQEKDMTLICTNTFNETYTFLCSFYFLSKNLKKRVYNHEKLKVYLVIVYDI